MRQRVPRLDRVKQRRRRPPRRSSRKQPYASQHLVEAAQRACIAGEPVVGVIDPAACPGGPSLIPDAAHAVDAYTRRTLFSSARLSLSQSDAVSRFTIHFPLRERPE